MTSSAGTDYLREQARMVAGRGGSTRAPTGRARGDMPVIGATRFQISSGDLSDRVPGLALGAVEVSLPRAGTSGTTSGAGRFAGRAFNFGGTFGAPDRLDGRVGTPLDLQVQIAAMAGESPSPGAPSALTLKGELALNAGAFDGLDAVVGLRLPALIEWRPVVPITLPALTDVSLGGHLLIPHRRPTLVGMLKRAVDRESNLDC